MRVFFSGVFRRAYPLYVCASTMKTHLPRLFSFAQVNLCFLNQVSKPWEEVASVDSVGESIVIGRYKGGNVSLKAASPSRR